MRRILVVPILLLVGATALTACGGGSNSASGHSASAGMGSSMDGSGSGKSRSMHGKKEMKNAPVVSGAPEIAVTGRAFAFDPKEIRVPAGQAVTINFKAVDLEHDFTVQGVGHVVHAKPGEVAKGGLKIDQPGRYAFDCTVSGHKEAGMTGTIIVEG